MWVGVCVIFCCNVLPQVNVSSTRFTSPFIWTDPGRYPVSITVSNIHGNVSAHTNVTVLYPINGLTFSTDQVIQGVNENVVLTLNVSSNISVPMGNVTYKLSWDTSVTEFGDLNVTAGQAILFSHVYTVQGDRNVTLQLTSPAQEKVLWVLVRIWDNLNVSLNLSATVGLPRDSFTLTFVNPPTAGFCYNISCGMASCTFKNNPSALYANFSPPKPPFSVTFSAAGVYVFTLSLQQSVLAQHHAHHHRGKPHHHGEPCSVPSPRPNPYPGWHLYDHRVSRENNERYYYLLHLGLRSK
ncbi:hypothetical protein C0Q70_01116 [Pomacea canaliculata]|uniref:PKD domain-containing protein n=1 Tax=Pomacea canaliculata TaxID=400727 RepID=A0A2T7PYK5_POMCA|nr:hypothetical protein C0Q70_01116 [Pomacea canaliculata]